MADRLPTATIPGLSAESLRIMVLALDAYCVNAAGSPEGDLAGMLRDRVASVKVRNGLAH